MLIRSYERNIVSRQELRIECKDYLQLTRTDDICERESSPDVEADSDEKYRRYSKEKLQPEISATNLELRSNCRTRVISDSSRCRSFVAPFADPVELTVGTYALG